ncbi:thioredoxin fold domain-containing protein [Kaarinaea lacus]
MAKRMYNFIVVVATATLLMFYMSHLLADAMDSYRIGPHGQANVKYPAWFKESFFDIPQDLDDARRQGKRGVILFLSQKACNHCQAFIDTTLKDPATKARVQKSYDVIGIDIFSDLELTDADGSVSAIRDFADTKAARLTPTLLFYGAEKVQLLKIVGLYPPEKFNAVLDYIEGEHYKSKKLGQYLKTVSSVTTATNRQQSVKSDYTLFSKPPYNLNRNKQKGKRPLLVVFEMPDCNPCSRFHQRVLVDKEVRQLMPSFDAVQLDASDNVTKITTPDGKTLTPQQWAGELQLAYDVAVVFFDEEGTEVHRLDSETGKDRMTGSMQYVLEKAYQRHEQYLRWRRENAIKKQQGN